MHQVKLFTIIKFMKSIIFLSLCFSFISPKLYSQNYINVTSYIDIKEVVITNNNLHKQLEATIFEDAPKGFLNELKNYKFITFRKTSDSTYICRLTNYISINSFPPIGYMKMQGYYIFINENIMSFMDFTENNRRFEETVPVPTTIDTLPYILEDDTPCVTFKYTNDNILNVEYFY